MDVFIINKNIIDVEIDERVKILKEKFDIFIDIFELKRDFKNEIIFI